MHLSSMPTELLAEVNIACLLYEGHHSGFNLITDIMTVNVLSA